MNDTLYPLLHGNIFIDEDNNIYIHENTFKYFLYCIFPDYSNPDSIIYNKLQNIIILESIYVTINFEKYYHENFIKKCFKLKNKD